MQIFANRADAGEQLGKALVESGLDEHALVLGLPRGGVPVASGVAQELQCELDVFVVRKIGVPGREELAMGALASDGSVVRNEAICDHFGISAEAFDTALADERVELDRRLGVYRRGRPVLQLGGRDVVVVDDGAATGASMAVALKAVALAEPAVLVAAVPVASREARRLFESVADRVQMLMTPEPFRAVGAWYLDFSQTTDAEVVATLAELSP